MEDFQIELGKALSKTTIGDPQVEGVRMGPLAGKEQVEEVQARIAELREGAKVVFGGQEDFEIVGGDMTSGSFMAPTVLLQEDPFNNTAAHEIEAFGPVTTIMPYNGIDEAITLSKMGKGSFMCLYCNL